MVDKIIASRQAAAQQQKIADERFVREDRILDDLAPRRWSEVHREMKVKCEQNPHYLTMEVGPSSGVLVRSVDRHVLQVEYLIEAKAIGYECETAAGEYSIRLDAAKHAVILDDNGMPFPSSAFVADRLLSLILKA